MFYVSLVLVIVAAITLVIGLLSSGLALVIVSIASSFAAGVFLILTVVRERPQLEEAPVGAGAPAPRADAAEEFVEEEFAEEEEELLDEEFEFPIADYDDLKVSEIVPLLPELEDDELEEVREHEEAGRGRATVLARIDELLAAADEEWAEEEFEFPIADYDALKVSEIVPLLSELEDDELEDVRERERAGKGRSTIVGRIDELLGEAPAPAKKAPAKKASAKKASAKKAPAKKAAAKNAFPISNYDDLNVGDVTSQLGGLTASELKQVRTYEAKQKARKGVLQKIDAELASR